MEVGYFGFEVDHCGIIKKNMYANDAIKHFRQKEETLPTKQSTSKTDIQIYSNKSR